MLSRLAPAQGQRERFEGPLADQGNHNGEAGSGPISTIARDDLNDRDVSAADFRESNPSAPFVARAVIARLSWAARVARQSKRSNHRPPVRGTADV